MEALLDFAYPSAFVDQFLATQLSPPVENLFLV